MVLQWPLKVLVKSFMFQNEWKGSKNSDEGDGPLISKQMTCGAPNWLWGHKSNLMGLPLIQTSMYPICEGWNNDASPPFVSHGETHPHLGPITTVKYEVQVCSRLGKVVQVHHHHQINGTQASIEWS